MMAKKLPSFILLFVLVSCQPQNKNIESHSPRKSFIVGGEVVAPDRVDVSYIVHFADGCAGNIINSKWILSAAHCAELFFSGLSGGSTGLKDSNRIKLTVKRFILHPGYESYDWGTRNDFALVELEQPIDFSQSKLAPIKLADSDFEKAGGLDEGVVATVLGWGYITDDGQEDELELLRSVNVPIVGRERANKPESYGGVIDSTMLAAGFDQGEKDACGGDSGGPLVVLDKKTNSNVLIGLVSWGEGCAQKNYYGIYSNVASAYDWIVKTAVE